MAKMIPLISNEEIIDAHGSAAEARVYQALREQLPEDVIVLYSVPWIEERNGLPPLDGEADFVILDPRRGMLVGEVKGGLLEVYSGARWVRRSGGQTEEIRSPFEQALGSRKVLERFCLRELGIDVRQCGSGHFVAFPDSTIRVPNVGASAPTEILLYGDDLDNVAERVSRLFEYWSAGHRSVEIPPGWTVRVAEALMPTRVMRPSLGAGIVAEAERFHDLTTRQAKLLSVLAHVRRARIDGAAGTGKTALAAAKAGQLAAGGKRTLLTCFNRPLADRLTSQLAGIDNLQVWTYHELCRQFAVKAGLSLPSKDIPMPSEYFTEELPRLLLESLDLLPDERFDALVVDEAQDFHGDWWATLTLLLKDADECPVYVFADAGQNLFQSDEFDPAELQSYNLSENVRNTRQIHEFASRFAPTRETDCPGPEGRPVEFVEADSARERLRAMSRTLHRLVNDEGVGREQIVIVTGRSVQNSSLGGVAEVGAFRLRMADQSHDGVPVESAWRFKGLEAPVVILTDFSTEVESNVRYVAATRAQSHLIVIGSSEENEAWGKRAM